MFKRGLIKKVDKGSIAEEAGIEIGDVLLSINGQDVTDIFDYRFFITDSYLMLNIEKPTGEQWEIEIEKDEYDDLGLEFEPDLIDREKSCKNKCIFCFIDQLPRNMRSTLYFKDDDVRLSFLTGNYVTLTNTNNDELDRIIKYKLSPVNISVHTTDPDLRCKMMNNKNAGDIMRQIAKLTENNIEVNCQLVICKGINDGCFMERSIEELASFYPGVNSISIVPVGLSEYRDRLYPLKALENEDALQIIKKVSLYQTKYLHKYGSRIVFCADELYIIANKAIPDYDSYETFPQLENGVGLMSLFEKELDDALKNRYKYKQGTLSIATGKAAEKFIKRLCDKITSMYRKEINVYGIENNFFGTTVNVTGLLTGKDIKEQLKNKNLGDRLLLSKSMFRAGEETFLDDMTREDLQRELGIEVIAVDNNGEDFLKYILGVN